MLSESPDSPTPGGVKTRAYPVAELGALVWVWMGEMEPVRLEEDVPAEFFDPQVKTYICPMIWTCNWRPIIDNEVDSHEVYLHRTSLSKLFRKVPGWEQKEVEVGERSVGMKRVCSGLQAEYRDLGKYPKYVWWRFRNLASVLVSSKAPVGLRVILPSIVRHGEEGHQEYMKFVVPVDKNHSLIFQITFRRIKNWWALLNFVIYARVWFRWPMLERFGASWIRDFLRQFCQDKRVLESLNYKWPEKLSATDEGVIQWRRLALKARCMQVKRTVHRPLAE